MLISEAPVAVAVWVPTTRPMRISRRRSTWQSAELLKVITDAGESAKSTNRPGLQRIIALIKRRAITAVIVAKLDRLTRSVRDLADLVELFTEHGVALASVAESLNTGSAAGRLVLNVMMSVSQWEREAIGERTRDALRHKKAQGQRVGTLPYGSRLAHDQRTLEPDEHEQHVLTQIRVLRARGLTLQAIADSLNGHGYHTRCGSAWRARCVHPLSVATVRVA